MKKNKIFLFLLLFLIPLFSLALETEYPAVGGTQPTDSTSPVEFVKYIFNLAILIGIIVAVFVMISQGAAILFARGDVAVVSLAKEKIKRVFIGLIILLGSYLILTTISPDLAIIDIKPLEAIQKITEPVKSEKRTQPSSEFEEIPLGTILESILAANSSERIYNDATEEVCYAYDENGDTIDRNGDKKIDDKDLLKGVDMYYCLSELNKALIKKIKDINGGNYLCNALPKAGPIEKMKELISSGCSCQPCDVWRPRFYCPGEECYQCKTYVCGECSTCCKDHCSCCGRAYYSPDSGCQDINDKNRDPCGGVRDGIDCARNEIKLRVDGIGYNVPGAAEDKCAFTKYFKENEYKFLTITIAKQRLDSFKTYFQNHLTDLEKAETMMKSPYGERLSLAEFETIQSQDQYNKTVAVPFQNTNSNYSYNPVKYCREFNCTSYKNGDSKNLCVSGERASLTTALMEKEKLIDPLYDKLPKITDKRICKVDKKEDKESYYYDGDGATFYFKQGYNTTQVNVQEKCAIDSTIEKETMRGLIPIGETVDATEKFAQDVINLLSQISTETQKTIEKAIELSTLPEKCDCSWGCSNRSDCACSSSKEGCSTCHCSSCLACRAKSQPLCICCQDCVDVEVIDENIPSPQDDMVKNFGSCPSCPSIVSTGNANEYWTYCPCSGTLLIPNTGLINNPNSRFCYLGSELGSYCSVHFQEANCQAEFKKLSPICIVSRINAPKFVNYTIESCETVVQEPTSSAILCGGGQKVYYTQKSILKLKPKGEIVTVCEGELPVDKELVDEINKYCNTTCAHEKGCQPGSFHWVSDNEFIMREIFCKGPSAPKDPQGLIQRDSAPYYNSLEVALPVGYVIEKVTAIPLSDSRVPSSYRSTLVPVQYYHIGTCSTEYTDEGPVEHCREAGYNTYHFIDDGYALLFKIRNTNRIKRGENDNRAEYVCPVNDIKDRQCRIFKYSDSDTIDPKYPENINTDYDCRNENSSGAGYLQKIELLNNRLENLAQGKDLRSDDVNRWTLLEKLSLIRTRLEACIQGYGFPNKEDLTKQRIFSCQEGIDDTILRSLVILPDFPYPPSKSYWNCYPFNSSFLTDEQKSSCYANKDAEGTAANPKCQRFISGLLDNYYCCQGE